MAAGGEARRRTDALDTDTGIGRRVLRLRTERGLTQRELAEPAYTAAYISTVESGKARPSPAALRHLAARLTVSEEELATGRPAHLATELGLRITEARHLAGSGDAREAAARLRELAAESARFALPEQEADARTALGDCALDLGDLDLARENYASAERLLSGAPLPRRAAAVRGRAVTHLLAGELRYACYLLESAIEELGAQGLQDPEALVLLHSAVIAPYVDMGAYARAAQSAELALSLAPRVEDPALVARMHRGVARAMLAAGRTAEADASLAKAQELYGQLHIRTELAHCHWMRGYGRAQEGDLAAAERELRRAQDMLVAERAQLFAAQVGVELADVLRRRGRREEAVAVLARLLDGIGAERGAVHAGAAHRLLGLISEEEGETGAAEGHYRDALSLLAHTGAAGDLADICRLLGDLLRRLGRTEAALDIYRTGLGHRAAPGTTTLGPGVEGVPGRAVPL
ncbi:regulatory protein [Streptomyces albus]|uniref:Regulatory protein n=1 Tax=Streptomyces albus (strain ATCC 21838 / DSM 41398 / FERM P-419 / JCM 4703 / NBRC 107858) TaxID=1081613 RepID=A0A0B5EX07_STRA4|nr:regulatory protein [Streptomyces albus]AOU80616.1 regulatory protein [Streptomyces albus]AYN36327.1 XRE family transcriptional regulator [Streptomyces albus]